MLFPKKVKHRKWQRGRKSPAALASMTATRGTNLQFGSFGLRATSPARIKSNQIEAARKVISRTVGKLGKYWIRVFPDQPLTAKPANVGMGKGKGDPQGFCFEIESGRIMFEVDGVSEAIAREALRKGGCKLPVTVRIISRETM
jgi:large subunit ribosomal protein L16